MAKSISAPYDHTEKTSFVRGTEWLVALAPIFIWSIYMFGARVITLVLISAACSLGLDFILQQYLFKRKGLARIDIMTAVYGILAAFMMPVTVPLYIPIVSSIFVVIAKNIRVFRAKRLFNPFVFSAAMLNLIFSDTMTTFTRPFAYFSAFSFSIDSKLIDCYKVISPLEYMADGSVYEDGVFAQLYGYASGCIGEIAIAAILLSLTWLCLRKEADWKSTVAFLVPILLLALAFPSDDAESNYYAYSVILSGAIVFLSVFATNESCTTPMTKNGKLIFAVSCGTLIFLMRKLSGGIEWGYYIVLILNIASPFIEKYTKPRVGKAKNKKG